MGHSIEHAEALANKFFGAIQRRDVDTFLSCYHPDARIWHNRDEADTDIAQNREAEKIFLERVSDLRYDILRRHHFDGGFVQEHVVNGKYADGSILRLPVLLIAHFHEDGRFIRVAEYLNFQKSPLKDLVQHSVPLAEAQ